MFLFIIMIIINNKEGDDKDNQDCRDCLDGLDAKTHALFLWVCVCVKILIVTSDWFYQ